MLPNTKNNSSKGITPLGNWIGTFLLCCGFFSCLSNEGDIIPLDKMKVMILEKQMVEEFYTNYIYKDTSINRDSARSVVFKQVFQLHKTDSARFYKSMAWYRSEPERFKILLDSATAYANRLREDRYKEQSAPKQSKDSAQ